MSNEPSDIRGRQASTAASAISPSPRRSFRLSMHNRLSLHPLAAAPGRRVAAGVVFLGIAVLAACGCGGGPRVEFVEGIVLFDGVPLDDAIVAFSPVQRGQGLPAVGKTGPDGKFTLTVVPQGGRRKGTGTAKGDYLVSVSKQFVEYLPPPPGAVPDAMGIIKPPPPKITDITPPRYGDIKTSGLTVSIVAGRNQPKLELSSK